MKGFPVIGVAQARLLAPAICLLVLSSCMPVKIETPPVQMNLSSAARNWSPNHTEMVKLRTYIDVGVRRTWLEDLVGVRCSVQNEYFSATVVTPAILAIPTVGNETKPTEISCSYNDEQLSDTSYCFYKGDGAPDPAADDPRGTCELADVPIVFGR